MLIKLRNRDLDNASLDNARLELDRRVGWVRGDSNKGEWLKLTSEVERLSNQLLERFS